MTEPQIKEYLLGNLPASELEKVDKVHKDYYEKHVPYYEAVEMIQEGEFNIELHHLISICDDVLNGRMKPGTVDLLSFIIIGSDYFNWDNQTKDGERIAAVLFEWNNETINYPLTMNNFIQWRKYLSGDSRRMES
jgi:hypothetical protein